MSLLRTSLSYQLIRIVQCKPKNTISYTTIRRVKTLICTKIRIIEEKEIHNINASNPLRSQARSDP